MVDEILKLEEGSRIQLLAPVVRGRKGQHVKLLDQAKRSGYARVRVDGNMYDLTEDIELDKNKKHNIEIIVDRIIIKEGIEKRLADSIENVLELADGLMLVDVIDGEEIVFSQNFSCVDCGISIEELEPRSFSFNNPFGACPVCNGIGIRMEFDEDLLIPFKEESIIGGAVMAPGWVSVTKEDSYTRAIMEALAKEYKFDLNTPYEKLPKHIRKMFIEGTGGKTVKVYYKGRRGEGVYDVALKV